MAGSPKDETDTWHNRDAVYRCRLDLLCWFRQALRAGVMLICGFLPAAVGTLFVLSDCDWAQPALGDSSCSPLSCGTTLCVGTSCDGLGCPAWWEELPLQRCVHLKNPPHNRFHYPNRQLRSGPRCQRKARHLNHHPSVTLPCPGRTHSVFLEERPG